MSYTGWLIPDSERSKLLAKFRTNYHDVLAHHITLRMGEAEFPPLETTAKIVGTMDDGEGCQVMVVSINGTTTRPDGKTFHITWSIDRDTHNRKPVHSHDVLAEHGYLKFYEPVDITIVPKIFKDE